MPDPQPQLGLLSATQRNLLIVGLALLVTIFFVLEAWHDHDEVQSRLISDAERAVSLARDEIVHYVEDQRRQLHIFTRDRRALIEALAANPDNAESRQALKDRLADCFPEVLSFSLIDANGHERVVDSEGLVTASSKENIDALLRGGSPLPLMAHAHPGGYHVNLMNPWTTSSGEREIFFISLSLRRMARILELNQNLGLKLYLLRVDDPGLIDLSSDGSRLDLDRPYRLSSGELAGLHARRAIPDSRWELVAIPDEEALAAMTQGIVGGLLRSGIILWLVAWMLVLLLNSKERQLAARRAAEMELLESNRELYQRATHDGLTGLANRPFMDDALQRTLRHAARERTPISVAMIDIDHFKAYNDGLGHLGGDECLRQVAAILDMSCQRPDDVVGRVGGEEFMVILPDTPLEIAITKLELAQARLAQRAMPHPRGGVVTFSAGVACLVPDQGQGLAHTVVEAADKALYRAKDAGRNRIEGIELGQASGDQAKPGRLTQPPLEPGQLAVAGGECARKCRRCVQDQQAGLGLPVLVGRGQADGLEMTQSEPIETGYEIRHAAGIVPSAQACRARVARAEDDP